MPTERTDHEPTREEIDRMPGPVLLEFGATWCGHCQAAAPLVQQALVKYSDVRHIKVEDGKGKPLGRSFKVKLWPTFVFLRDGQVKHQAVRPQASEIIEGLEAIHSAAPQ